MRQKKLTLAVALATGLGALPAQANTSEYMMVVPTKVENGVWRGLEPIYSSWANEGAHYDCTTWDPSESSVDLGQSFMQYRDCSQDQVRSVTTREQHTATNEIRETGTHSESRTTTETESQNAVGTRQDWQSASSTYTNWDDSGTPYGYTDWSPVASTQTTSFTQTRDYQQDQTRQEQRREQDTVTGNYRDVGEPVSQSRTQTRSESRNVDVNWTAWANSGSQYNCSAWTPDPSTVNHGEAFTQERTCDQGQTRDRVYTVDSSPIETKTESKTIQVSQNRQSTGTYQNWEPMTSSASSWSDDGSGYNYSEWSPAAANQTANFQQTQSYDQDQSRTVQNREYDTVTGETRDSGEPYTETRTVSQSNTRTVSVSASSWSDTGSRYGCSAWSPHESTVNQGQSFTQRRDCTQPTTRTWTYQADGSVIHSRDQNSSRTVQESRTRTGTKAVSECRYTYNTDNGYFITDNRSMGMIRLQWSTDYWFHNTYSMPTESAPVTRGSYKYWTGAKKTSTYFEICRKPN